jgi:1-acyl-sn-glycerol-3-phosphate acyltransferase
MAHKVNPKPLSTFMQRVGLLGLKLLGWKRTGNTPPIPKFVAVVAPHTANGDFLPFLLLCWSHGLRPHFIGKHTLFKWPIGILMRWCGGIPVNRSSSKDLVSQIVDVLNENERLVLGIAPEGTRKYVDHWKSGFYHMAHNAGVPIIFGAIDAPGRELNVSDPFYTTGNIDADMAAIAEHFSRFRGINPENAAPVRLKPRREN